MEIMQKVLAFMVTLGVLIVFHEWGHYIVARLCGVKVLRFSVGFGRVLFSRRWGRDRTEWALSAVPLGGYVKMLDERETEVGVAERHRAFNRQGVARRIAIVAAGPIANLVLAIGLFAALFMAGVDGYRALLAAPVPGSVVEAAGIQAGDEVRSVEGERVQSWQDLRWRLLRHSGASAVDLVVQSEGGQPRTVSLPLSGLGAADWESDYIARLGFALRAPPLSAEIGRLVAGGPAELAGMRVGDRVESIDGQPVERWADLARIVGERPGKAYDVVVVREGRREVLGMKSESFDRDGRKAGRIGVSPKPDPAAYESLRVVTRYGFFDALTQATRKTWELSVFTVKMLYRIVIGEASLKNISGPLTMADYAGQSAQQGLNVFVGYLALISISLGVLNLLPVPLLDGGHLLYYAFEIIKGRPLSERTFEIGQQIGMAVLFALMGLALYNDFARLFQ